MKKSKPTVTIGIPAYNEEENISHLLDSILKQKEKTIQIQKIIVISDGSTDKTVPIIQRFIQKDPRVNCVVGHSRMGKPARLNQLFNSMQTDVLVILDADTICSDDLTIEKLVCKFKSGKKVGLVSGRVLPLPARSFIERAINNYKYARSSVEDIFDFGKTSYCVHGYLAYSKELLRKLHFPPNIVSNDGFSYFACKTLKFKNIFAKDSVVFYRSPCSIKDYMLQMIRYIKAGIQIRSYFGEELVDSSNKLPTDIKLRILRYQLKKDPLAYLILKCITLLCRFYCRILVSNPSTIWSISISSKKLVWQNPH